MNKEIKNVEEIYHQLFPALLLQGKIMGANEHMIRDTIHDIFLELIEKKQRTSGIKNFKAYVSVSFRRRLAKNLKKQFSDIDEAKVQSQDSYEDFLVENEETLNLKLNLRKALDALAPSQRTIIKLRFYSGLTYEEISAELGIKIRTVYNQVHSSVKTLRKNINLK